MRFYLDFAENVYFFQDAGSQNMLSLIDLHNRIFFFLILLAVFVFWMITSSLLNKDYIPTIVENDTLEVVWTIIPTLIIISIVLPSLHLLYVIDEILDPSITVKVIASQWSWSYELSDYVDENGEGIIEIDSFIKGIDSLELGELRNLEAEEHLVLPVNTSIRFLVTSKDVIHSFAIPSLGLKIDAIPGRLNSTGVIITRPSTYFGQCSELCGTLHGFMPIKLEAVELKDYISYVNEKINE